MTLVPFTEWRPDAATLNTPYEADVLNVLCSDGSYIPFPKLAPFSTALPAQPLGGFSARNSAGQIIIFVGTATKLYTFNTLTLGWTDVSQAGPAYNATVDERWRFKQFGDFVVAVNVNDDPQVFEIGVSATFLDLAGSPPRARYISIWGDFLVLFNDNRATWSALNDITGWTPGVNNSDFQEFPDGGDIQGSTDATNPIIFLKSAIQFGTFMPGSVEIFTFVKVHDKRGAAAPYAIASRGAYTFFADSGGFFQIGSDGTIAPIGFEKVDRTVFTQVTGAGITQIIGEVDPFYTRVYWAVRYASITDGFDRLIVYDWNLQKWTQIDGTVDILFPLSSGTVGFTLEGLDMISSSLDALPYSLDSKVWQGGAPVMAAFDVNNMLGFFSGTNAEAILTTTEKGDVAGGVTRISSMYPVIDSNNCTMAIGSRMKRGDPIVWTPEIYPTGSTGRYDKLNAARFQSMRVTIPDSEVWYHAQGIDVDAKKAGR